MTESNASGQQVWVRLLVREHQQPLIRYARSLVGNVETARDIVQETFLRLCKQSPDALVGHEAAWLYRVCHNLALNHLRKDKRMQSNTDAVRQAESHCDGDRRGDPSDHLVADDEAQRLMHLIEALPDNQQQVIRLKFHAGLKYREIGDATGLSTSNVGFLLHTALQTLRQQMQT